MDMSYKVLWIDDDEDYVESSKDFVSESAKKYFMNAEFEVFNEYDKFKEQKLSNFDAQSFDLYDLILVDYALSGTTGNRIIRELRDKKIYTDIIFYSSDIETMKNELKSEEQLDGVFLIERENLFSMIEQIIQKNLKREYRISNIRGLIMDSTSEFDYICQETAIALFEKLDKDQQNSVVDKTREYVNDAATKSKRNFTDLNKKQGKKFVENALRSVEYDYFLLGTL